MLLFGLIIFLSAFLLFQIQPLIAKFFLSWFGGAPSVWVTAMLVFQVLLLMGYGYSHLAVLRLRLAAQSRVQQGLILVGLLWVAGQWLGWGWPLFPTESYRQGVTQQPAAHLILLLGISVALPFFLLATTNSLIQAWFGRVYTDRSPYPLYALSNTGSLLGLLSYPFVLEPLLGLRQQAMLWTAAFVVYGLGMFMIAHKVKRHGTDDTASHRASDPDHRGVDTEPRLTRVMWFLLSFTGVAMFLGTSNLITMDIGGLALLWVVPLAIFLGSFIYTFRGNGYSRLPWLGAGLVAVVALAVFASRPTGAFPVLVQFGVPLFALVVGTVLCHGELYLLRPARHHLTDFYLWVAIGGACAGVTIAIIAPLVFSAVREFHLSFLLGFMLVALVLAAPKLRPWLRRDPSVYAQVAAGLAVVGMLAVTAYGWSPGDSTIYQNRNFFGVVSVEEAGTYQPAGDPVASRIFVMAHGGTLHGIAVEGRPHIATAYFSPESGVGFALLNHPARASATEEDPFKIGILGLGAGTLTAYATAQDVVRVYEIDPAVITLAGKQSPYFDAIARSPADITIVEGDARISLEEELNGQGSQRFDILILDAFTGDAPPNHLLTLEAFRLYEKHLSDTGIIVANISNRYFDFVPLLNRQAEALGWSMRYYHHRLREKNPLLQSSQWMLLSPKAENLRFAEQREATSIEQVAPIQWPWTDNYTNPMGILRMLNGS